MNSYNWNIVPFSPSIYKDLWLPRWREGLKSRLTCAGELQGWTLSPWLACRTWRWGDIGAGRSSFGTSRTPQLVSRRCRMSFLQVKKKTLLTHSPSFLSLYPIFSFTFSLDKLLEKAIAVLFAEMNFFFLYHKIVLFSVVPLTRVECSESRELLRANEGIPVYK